MQYWQDKVPQRSLCFSVNCLCYNSIHYSFICHISNENWKIYQPQMQSLSFSLYNVRQTRCSSTCYSNSVFNHYITHLVNLLLQNLYNRHFHTLTVRAMRNWLTPAAKGHYYNVQGASNCVKPFEQRPKIGASHYKQKQYCLEVLKQCVTRAR